MCVCVCVCVCRYVRTYIRTYVFYDRSMTKILVESQESSNRPDVCYRRTLDVSSPDVYRTQGHKAKTSNGNMLLTTI